ncbi:MAG: hypothetical protein ABI653_02010, partial [Bacteroidota bacterium]
TYLYYILFSLIGVNNCSNNPSLKSGTYVSESKTDSKYLRIYFFSDTLFAFTFGTFENSKNEDGNKQLDFNYSSDFGIGKKLQDKWIAYMDYSYLNREYGDFKDDEKNETNGVYNIINFLFNENELSITIIQNKIRTFLPGNYKLVDNEKMNFNIDSNFKIIPDNLIYQSISQTNLLAIPDNTLYENGQLLEPGEKVYIENEYKNFVFVVTYNRGNKVGKYGWVRRKDLKK